MNKFIYNTGFALLFPKIHLNNNKNPNPPKHYKPSFQNNMDDSNINDLYKSVNGSSLKRKMNTNTLQTNSKKIKSDTMEELKKINYNPPTNLFENLKVINSHPPTNLSADLEIVNLPSPSQLSSTIEKKITNIIINTPKYKIISNTINN